MFVVLRSSWRRKEVYPAQWSQPWVTDNRRPRWPCVLALDLKGKRIITKSMINTLTVSVIVFPEYRGKKKGHEWNLQKCGNYVESGFLIWFKTVKSTCELSECVYGKKSTLLKGHLLHDETGNHPTCLFAPPRYDAYMCRSWETLGLLCYSKSLQEMNLNSFQRQRHVLCYL